MEIFLWQDVVLMIAGFVFAPSLIVSIRKRVKYPLGTSLPTALALVVVAICCVSLGLYLATVSTVFTAICWAILVFRRK